MFDKGSYRLRWAHPEDANSLDDIQHPILREALRFYEVPRGIEIVSLADIPSGTGLGSSGAFTVGLCHALSAYMGLSLDRRMLARHAAEIELEILGRGGGCQDHYACALGGVTSLHFCSGGAVEDLDPLISSDLLECLESRLHLFFTGYSRNANDILISQSDVGLKAIKASGRTALRFLRSGDLDRFGDLFNDHWLLKKLRSDEMTNPDIDLAYKTGMASGAIGGKIVGAGGGGFLLFYTKHPEPLAYQMQDLGLSEVSFKFDYNGTTCRRL